MMLCKLPANSASSRHLYDGGFTFKLLGSLKRLQIPNRFRWKLSFQGRVKDVTILPAMHSPWPHESECVHSQDLIDCSIGDIWWQGTFFQTFPCFGLLLLLILLQSSTCFNAMHAALISILRVDNLWGQLKQSIQVWEEPLIHSNSSHWIINNPTGQKLGVKAGRPPIKDHRL